MKWIGNGSGEPPVCDIGAAGMDATHQHDMKPGFVDGATQFGPWALMCLPCHERYGKGIGTGRGQKYNGTTYEKIAG